MKLVIGFILAFIYSLLILPKESNNIPLISPTISPFLYKGMIIIPFSKKKAIHLHHWIIYLLIIVFSNKMNDILFGFMSGLIFQGLFYNDSLNFICKNPF